MELLDQARNRKTMGTPSISMIWLRDLPQLLLVHHRLPTRAPKERDSPRRLDSPKKPGVPY